MKLVAVFLMSAAITLHAGSLENHRWKHRLLVIPQPTPALLAEIKKYDVGIIERDLKIITLGQEPKPLHQEIADRFKLTPACNEILLIGKDGNTTIKWTQDTFSIEQLFLRIDSMPMRLREMRETKSN